VVTVEDARALAAARVAEEGSRVSGVVGAYTAGSTNSLTDDAPLSPSSDLDVMLELSIPEAPVKPGKQPYHGALLELTYLSDQPFTSAETLLAHYQLANSFQSAQILLDPSGRVAALQAEVRREYPKAERVRQRIDHVESNLRGSAGAVSTWDVLHEQVTCTFFAAGGLTHVLLVAALRNPNVRLRCLAARELLVVHGRLDFYQRLLEPSGCAAWSRSQTREHLASMTAAFDEAGSAIRTPIYFATDLDSVSRPIAVDGTRELIERGDHREAVFWIVATYARCMSDFHRDGWPELRGRHLPGFWRMLHDFGIRSHDDLKARSGQVVALLPETRAVADAIVAATPGIT
jgi:hypothetical protein